MNTLLLVLDLVGTFVFAVSGAMAGVERRFDVFGVLVLSFVVATFGGISRDVLIGTVPPAALTDWRYLAISMVAGVITFYGHTRIDRLQHPLLIFDAMGLSIFAVSGAEKAFIHGLGPWMAALLGMLTGIGGGMARDLLLARIPTVLRADIYATAAFAGAAVVMLGHTLRLPPIPVTIAGAGLCFGLRTVAIRRRWQLPTADRGNTGDRTGNAEDDRHH
jgi:uncharacterized membrane protein YeiH